MKKSMILWLLILGTCFPLFAQVPPVAFIYLQPITGVGSSFDDKTFITTMITNEAHARNCAFLDSPYGADFIMYGMISPYYEGYEDWYIKDTSPNITTYSYNALMQDKTERVFIFQLVLKDTKTNGFLVIQNLYYASLDDVYNFFPLLVYNLFSHILKDQPVAQAPSKDTDNWRNKWLYLRTSVDFPITYYKLQNKGLIGGIGVYAGEFDNPDRVASLDNKVVSLPSMTIGFEVQFLNWMSIEPKFQVGLDHMNGIDFFRLATGLELKVPLKFLRNLTLAPYGAAIHTFLTPEDIFVTPSPWIGCGGGIQISTYGGKAGAAFIDVNYMYLGDVGIKNQHGDLYPNPEIIHYRRSVFSIGVGYKAGFINRNGK